MRRLGLLLLILRRVGRNTEPANKYSNDNVAKGHEKGNHDKSPIEIR